MVLPTRRPTLVRHADCTTVLTGPVADQTQLHGVLARVRDRGVHLLPLSRVDSAALAAQTSCGRVVRRSGLAAAVIGELADGGVIGDFMLRVEDAWAQAEVAE